MDFDWAKQHLNIKYLTPCPDFYSEPEWLEDAWERYNKGECVKLVDAYYEHTNILKNPKKYLIIK